MKINIGRAKLACSTRCVIKAYIYIFIFPTFLNEYRDKHDAQVINRNKPV